MSVVKKKIIFEKEKFQDVIDCVKDLITIDKTIMFKINSEKIFMYSAVGGTPGVLMKLFRSQTLNTEDYIANSHELDDIEFNYIIAKGDKLFKALNIMNIEENDVTLTLNLRYNDSKEDYDARAGEFKCGNLKVTYIGAERNAIVDTNRVKLERLIDVKNSIWGFEINQQEFKTIKKIASLETGEDNRTFTARAENGVVYINERNEWELQLCEIDDTNNYEVSFVKKFFNNIRDTSEILSFMIFESFIVVESIQSLLLMGYETNFEEY